MASKKDAYNTAAHLYYVDHTEKTCEELEAEGYHRFNWADAVDQGEFFNIDDAIACGEEAARQAVEAE